MYLKYYAFPIQLLRLININYLKSVLLPLEIWYTSSVKNGNFFFFFFKQIDTDNYFCFTGGLTQAFGLVTVIFVALNTLSRIVRVDYQMNDIKNGKVLNISVNGFIWVWKLSLVFLIAANLLVFLNCMLFSSCASCH